jgi:hypothetical protein
MLGYGVWSAWRSTRASAWPSTPDVLTNVALKENSDSDGPTYEVQVTYTYTVSGNAYSGSRLAFGYVPSGSREAHQEIYEKLTAAKSVDVHYDPDDPATSALSFGIHRSIRFVLAFAITWLAFVVGFTMIWWVASRADRTLIQNLSVQ